MTDRPNGGPAFPVPVGFVSSYNNQGPNDPIPDNPWINTANGMSLRDFLAAHAPRYPFELPSSINETASMYDVAANMATWRYAYADAMLKERDV